MMPAEFSFDMLLREFPELEGILGIVLGVYLVIILLVMLFSLTCYILQSLGLYGVAKRRGIRRPWLAWLPVGNMWILGSISDQYQYVAKGKVRNTRKILLVLVIALYLLTTFSSVGVISMIVKAISGFSSGQLMATAVAASGAQILTVVLAIVGAVFQYIAYYNLFKSSAPEDATLFLVLGIFFSVALPFFVFNCRKKDYGMPPRKAAQPPVSEIAPAAEEDDFVSEETPGE